MIKGHGAAAYAFIAAAAFAVSMLATGRMIPLLRKKQFGQFIREEGPEAHLSKAGTPTMGGLAWITGVTVAMVISMFMPGSETVPKIAILLSMFAFVAIGFIDDYNKIAKKQNEGLTPKQKLLLQVLFGVALAVFMMIKEGTTVLIPFARVTVDMGWLYIPFIVFIEVAMANAVNLTDGLDGLSSSTSAIVACTFAIIGMSLSLPITTLTFAITYPPSLYLAQGRSLSKLPQAISHTALGNLPLRGSFLACMGPSCSRRPRLRPGLFTVLDEPVAINSECCRRRHVSRRRQFSGLRA